MTQPASTPLISIITVCRNAIDTVMLTVRSVLINAQSMPDVQYIIIDGASDDGTVAQVKNMLGDESKMLYSPVIVSEPDSGIYDAMNKGLERADGRYVLFLNAGDTLHAPDTLLTIKTAIERCEYEPGIVYGDTVIVNATGTASLPRHLPLPDHLTIESMKTGMAVCHQAFIPLRKITSPFDTRYRLSADYDWCIRCLQRSRYNLNLHAVVANYLFVGASTRNRRRSLIERFKIMCYYFGLMPTLIRHITFLPRRLKRRRAEKHLSTL